MSQSVRDRGIILVQYQVVQTWHLLQVTAFHLPFYVLQVILSFGSVFILYNFFVLVAIQLCYTTAAWHLLVNALLCCGRMDMIKKLFVELPLLLYLRPLNDIVEYFVVLRQCTVRCTTYKGAETSCVVRRAALLVILISISHYFSCTQKLTRQLANLVCLT